MIGWHISLHRSMYRLLQSYRNLTQLPRNFSLLKQHYVTHTVHVSTKKTYFCPNKCTPWYNTRNIHKNFLHVSAPWRWHLVAETCSSFYMFCLYVITKCNCWKNIDIKESLKRVRTDSSGWRRFGRQGARNFLFTTLYVPKQACRPEHSYIPV